MIIPERLQVGTPFRESIVGINRNFDEMVQNIDDFNVILEAVQYTTYANTIAAGDQLNSIFAVLSSFPKAQIGGVSAAFTILVDTPDPSNPDAAYAYPDGASCTGGRRAFKYGGVMMNNGITGIAVDTPYTYSGKTWYYVTDYVVWIKNYDASAHDFLIMPAFRFISAPASAVYR